MSASFKQKFLNYTYSQNSSNILTDLFIVRKYCHFYRLIRGFKFPQSVRLKQIYSFRQDIRMLINCVEVHHVDRL